MPVSARFPPPRLPRPARRDTRAVSPGKSEQATALGEREKAIISGSSLRSQDGVLCANLVFLGVGCRLLRKQSGGQAGLLRGRRVNAQEIARSQTAGRRARGLALERRRKTNAASQAATRLQLCLTDD